MNKTAMTAQFTARFPKANAGYLALYLSLRAEGDTHSAAVETVLCEMQMAALSR